MTTIEKCRALAMRHAALEAALGQAETLADQKKYLSVMREYNQLSPIATAVNAYDTHLTAKLDAEALMHEVDDSDLYTLAKEEFSAAAARLAELQEEMRLLLLPKDEDDDRSVIVEIRAGAGGEEAALFASDLLRMYHMYADKMNWKTSLVSANETELGGYRSVTFFVEGEGAYARMKFESGVHRVQRVPETESQGRIQTSTVTVAVLPEIEDVEIDIPPSDIKMETCKSSGAGGQHINKTESAVRILHIPTGIVIECQEERSQFKNRDRAMKMLRAKLYEMERERRDTARADARRAQVGSGDRSEKIRTYNFPQRRVTDHRINFTLYTLESMLNGAMDAIIDALCEADTAKKLAESGET